MNNEITELAHNLMLSPTMEKIGRFAQGFPFDVNNKEELKTAYATLAISLVSAADNGQIVFNDTESSAIFHGLMVIAFNVITDGMLESMITKASTH